MVNFDDYTQPLEKVVWLEKVYAQPATGKELQDQFDEWIKINPLVAMELEHKALELQERLNRVAAKYLIEWFRMERTEIPVRQIAFFDTNGNKHKYRLNNNYAPCLGRWLLKKYPHLNLAIRESKVDNHE